MVQIWRDGMAMPRSSLAWRSLTVLAQETAGDREGKLGWWKSLR